MRAIRLCEAWRRATDESIQKTWAIYDEHYCGDFVIEETDMDHSDILDAVGIVQFLSTFNEMSLRRIFALSVLFLPSDSLTVRQ
jgi:hypothetical protein